LQGSARGVGYQAISVDDDEVIAMLSEKFFLVLETLRSHASDDKPPIVVKTGPQIPIKPPSKKQTSDEAAN
jgi:hypothetical protein